MRRSNGITLNKAANSLIRNFMEGFTYLALNSSLDFGKEFKTCHTIMMITWKALWVLEDVEASRTVKNIFRTDCRAGKIHISLKY